jgi:hypothetical protein
MQNTSIFSSQPVRAAKPEMRLRADAVVRSSSELFPSGGAVQDYLRSAQRLEPFDPYAPEADADLLTHLTPEPLCLLELEARVFETFPPESIVVDSAWRWVDRRKLVLTETAFERSESAVPAT